TLDDIDDDVAFGRRDAGGGLVEEQHSRLERQRYGKLDEALATIGELAHVTERIIGKSQRLERAKGFVHEGAVGARRPVHVAGGAEPLADGKADILEHAQ